MSMTETSLALPESGPEPEVPIPPYQTPTVAKASRLQLWTQQIPKINAFESELQEDTIAQLRKRSLSLRYRARSGEKLKSLLPEAYALVREAATRSLGLRHFPVQLLGGIALFHNSVAEMETGEGKTLTATLPLYLRSLEGKGSHLATVNDYLARRDATEMGPIYTMLGLTVGCTPWRSR